MKKSLLEIYALAVCFVTVICFVVASGIFFYSLVQVSSPTFTMDSYQYNQHQTNDAFWSSGSMLIPPEATSGLEEKARNRPSEPELTKQRLESYELATNTEWRNGLQSLVKTLIVILIDIVVFYFHWRISKRARHESNA